MLVGVALLEVMLLEVILLEVMFLEVMDSDAFRMKRHFWPQGLGVETGNYTSGGENRARAAIIAAFDGLSSGAVGSGLWKRA
jgi:hypothetical protein